jgi:hypothetical protein
MKCFVCGCTAWSRALYRVNEKGVPGVWACEEHIPRGKEPDPEVHDIIKALEDPK